MDDFISAIFRREFLSVFPPGGVIAPPRRMKDQNVPRDGDAKAGCKRPVAEIEIVEVKSIEYRRVEFDRLADFTFGRDEQAVQRLDRRNARRSEAMEEKAIAVVAAMDDAAMHVRPARRIPVCTDEARCSGNAD